VWAIVPSLRDSGTFSHVLPPGTHVPGYDCVALRAWHSMFVAVNEK